MTIETYNRVVNARKMVNDLKRELALLEVDINGEGDIKELDDIKRQIKDLRKIISQYDDDLKQYEF
ncbi:MAG: hypothetical protein WC303_03090 [Candidatus Paceibacterota bacterium]